MKAKHQGDKPIGCPACLTRAEKTRLPWHTIIDHFIQWEVNYNREHAKAMKRKEKRICG